MRAPVSVELRTGRPQREGSSKQRVAAVIGAERTAAPVLVKTPAKARAVTRRWTAWCSKVDRRFSLQLFAHSAKSRSNCTPPVHLPAPLTAPAKRPQVAVLATRMRRNGAPANEVLLHRLGGLRLGQLRAVSALPGVSIAAYHSHEPSRGLAHLMTSASRHIQRSARAMQRVGNSERSPSLAFRCRSTHIDAN